MLTLAYALVLVNSNNTCNIRIRRNNLNYNATFSKVIPKTSRKHLMYLGYRHRFYETSCAVKLVILWFRYRLVPLLQKMLHVKKTAF